MTDIVLNRFLEGFALYSLLWVIYLYKLDDNPTFSKDLLDAKTVTPRINKYRLNFVLVDNIAAKVAVIFILISFLYPLNINYSISSSISVYYYLECFKIFSSLGLWFKYSKNKRWYRLIVALLFLLPSQNIILFITALHRDYLPSSWTMDYPLWLYFTRYLLSIFIFCFITWVIYFYKTKYKRG